MWPDPQGLLQPDHARGGFDGEVAFGRVRQGVNHLGVGACGGRPRVFEELMVKWYKVRGCVLQGWWDWNTGLKTLELLHPERGGWG